MRGVRPWQSGGGLTVTLSWFQSRHGQQLVNWLALSQAQTRGKVHRHHTGRGAPTDGMENSEEEAMMGL